MILYRLNRVPDKNYIKFLELLGVQLKPPQPARAELTFKLSSNKLTNFVPISQGTKVSLGESEDGRPVIFETEDNLTAVAAEVKELQSYDGAQYRRLTESNRVADKFFYAFGPHPQPSASPVSRLRL